MPSNVRIQVDALEPYRVRVIYAIEDKAEKTLLIEPGAEDTITFEPGKSDLFRITREKV